MHGMWPDGEAEEAHGGTPAFPFVAHWEFVLHQVLPVSMVQVACFASAAASASACARGITAVCRLAATACC